MRSLKNARRDPDVRPAGPTVPEKWVKAVAKDLAEHAGRAAVVVGPRQPAWVHALAHAVNDALGAHRLRTSERPGARSSSAPPPPEVDSRRASRELAADMRDGKVNTLLVIGGNPVFNAPADLNFASELQKVATKIRLGLFHDQTSEACDWHLPLAHSLESWGDTETSDGTLCCVQPLDRAAQRREVARRRPTSNPRRAAVARRSKCCRF